MRLKRTSVIVPVLWTLLIVLGLVIIPTPGCAGDREELALRIFTLQEETQVLQDKFKASQAEYVKLRDQVKKEADHAKKGEAAVKILRLEEELVAMADRVNKKSAEVAEARARFKEIVK